MRTSPKDEIIYGILKNFEESHENKNGAIGNRTGCSGSSRNRLNHYATLALAVKRFTLSIFIYQQYANSMNIEDMAKLKVDLETRFWRLEGQFFHLNRFYDTSDM